MTHPLVQIFLFIRDNARPSRGDIEAALHYSGAQVSRYLARLRQAGLIIHKQCGARQWYEVAHGD